MKPNTCTKLIMEIIKVILDNKLTQSPEDFKQYPLASIFITFS